jgi:hypothetical protein
MPTLTVKGPNLVVGLSSWEKVKAVHGNVSVPVTAVRSVVTEPDPWPYVRGVKVAGTGIHGVAAYGVRHYKDGREFVAVEGTAPAVRIELDGARYASLLVTVPDTENMVAVITAAAGVKS